MRVELWILLITAFLVYNAYHDGKYMKMLLSYKKYYTMGFYCILGLGIYLLFKRNPEQGKNMLQSAHNVVKYMPIDKSSLDLLSPIFDLTSKGNSSFMEGFNKGMNPDFQYNPVLASQQQQIILSGSKSTKRSVSETKKKYVASMQDWKCGQCNKKLSHTFEIDHKIRLEHGGGNDATNLVALCRECHGEKTALENM